MITLPPHYGVALFALFFGINGIWLAHKLFWTQRPDVFWFTAGGIVLAIACLIVTGAAESIARWLWPVALDPVEAKKFERYVACDGPRQSGFMLIAGPILLILGPIWLLTQHQYTAIGKMLSAIVVAVCVSLLWASPLPEKLARSVFSDDTLKVPSNCAQARR